MYKINLPANKKLIIISGPSGVGKSTIIKELLKNNDIKINPIFTTTTRPPRPNEIAGNTDRNFISRQEFEQKIANDEMIEYELIPGINEYYGKSKQDISTGFSTADFCIMDMESEGFKTYLKIMNPVNLISFLITVPEEILLERLTARGTDTNEQIQHRIQLARSFKNNENLYNYVLTNDNLENTVNQILTIIKSKT